MFKQKYSEKYSSIKVLQIFRFYRLYAFFVSGWRGKKIEDWKIIVESLSCVEQERSSGDRTLIFLRVQANKNIEVSLGYVLVVP